MGAGVGRSAGPEDIHDYAAGLCCSTQHGEHADGAQPGALRQNLGGVERGQAGAYPRDADCAERVGRGGVCGA